MWHGGEKWWFWNSNLSDLSFHDSWLNLVFNILEILIRNSFLDPNSEKNIFNFELSAQN